MDISVIIPVYNAARFIEKTISSVLLQPEVRELILVDDGSQDRSLIILRTAATKDKRIKVYWHEGHANRGPGASRNLGLAHANSSWISFLDADDYLLPGRFTRVAATWQRYPDADGFCEAIENENVHGDDALVAVPHSDIPRVVGPGQKIAPAQALDLFFGPHFEWASIISYTLRTDFLRKHDLQMAENIRQAEEILFLARVLLHGTCYTAGTREKPLIRRCLHGENTSFQLRQATMAQVELYGQLLPLFLQHRGRVSPETCCYTLFKRLQYDPYIIPWDRCTLLRIPAKLILLLRLLFRYPDALIVLRAYPQMKRLKQIARRELKAAGVIYTQYQKMKS